MTSSCYAKQEWKQVSKMSLLSVNCITQDVFEGLSFTVTFTDMDDKSDVLFSFEDGIENLLGFDYEVTCEESQFSPTNSNLGVDCSWNNTESNDPIENLIEFSELSGSFEISELNISSVSFNCPFNFVQQVGLVSLTTAEACDQNILDNDTFDINLEARLLETCSSNLDSLDIPVTPFPVICSDGSGAVSNSIPFFLQLDDEPIEMNQNNRLLIDEVLTNLESELIGSIPGSDFPVRCRTTKVNQTGVFVNCNLLHDSTFNFDEFGTIDEKNVFKQEKLEGFLIQELFLDCNQNFIGATDNGELALTSNECNENLFVTGSVIDLGNSLELACDGLSFLDGDIVIPTEAPVDAPPEPDESGDEEDVFFILIMSVASCLVLVVLVVVFFLRQRSREKKKDRKIAELLQSQHESSLKFQMPLVTPLPVLEVCSAMGGTMSLGTLNTAVTTDSYRSLVSPLDISSQKKLKALDKDLSTRISKIVVDGNAQLGLTLHKLIERVVDYLFIINESDTVSFADFTLEAPPDMTLESYLERLAEGVDEWYHEHEENSVSGVLCVLFAVGYISSLQQKKDLQLTETNVHSLFGVAFLIAAKFLEDEPISLQFWSNVSGIPFSELTILEQKLCFAIGFDVFFDAEDFNKLLDKFN